MKYPNVGDLRREIAALPDDAPIVHIIDEAALDHRAYSRLYMAFTHCVAYDELGRIKPRLAGELGVACLYVRLTDPRLLPGDVAHEPLERPPLTKEPPMRTIEEIRQAVAHEAQSQANQLEAWRQRLLPALVSNHMRELDKAVQRQVALHGISLLYNVTILEEPKQLRQQKVQALCVELVQQLEAAGYTAAIRTAADNLGRLQVRVAWALPDNGAEEENAWVEAEEMDAEALAGDD